MEARIGNSLQPHSRRSLIRTKHRTTRQPCPGATSTLPTHGPVLKSTSQLSQRRQPYLQEFIHEHSNPVRATPSLVWPLDLIPILQQIVSTACHQPTNLLFAFDFSFEAANKNFILLKHKLSGNFQKALLAQSDMPLGCRLEYKPIKMLKPIFKNHPSWSRMKQVFTHGSRWPLLPLNKENQIKDIEEALVFGNHKGTVQQQDLIRKLVTDNVI